MEAADLVLETVARRWADGCPPEAAAVAAQIIEATREIPRQWRDDDADCSFSAALAVSTGGAIEVVAAGLYGVYQLLPGDATALFRPPRWIDEPVRQGLLSAEDARVHPLREVMAGPFVADRGDRPPQVLGPFPVPRGSRLVIADDRVMRVFLAMPEAERPQDARGIQELGARNRLARAPVIVA